MSSPTNIDEERAFPIPDRIRQAVVDAAGKPVLLEDQSTGEQFVVMPLGAYVALCRENAPDRLTIEEQQWLLMQAGRRAGWDDPEMDIYSDIEPNRA